MEQILCVDQTLYQLRNDGRIQDFRTVPRNRHLARSNLVSKGAISLLHALVIARVHSAPVSAAISFRPHSPLSSSHLLRYSPRRITLPCESNHRLVLPRRRRTARGREECARHLSRAYLGLPGCYILNVIPREFPRSRYVITNVQ